jgi:hypothetical protein
MLYRRLFLLWDNYEKSMTAQELFGVNTFREEPEPVASAEHMGEQGVKHV